jgi:putative modified peptide
MANSSKPLPARVVAYLLDKLSSDDAFRKLFVNDLIGALRQAGAADPEGCAQCLKVPRLADKATIAASRDALVTELTGNLNLQAPQLIAR